MKNPILIFLLFTSSIILSQQKIYFTESTAITGNTQIMDNTKMVSDVGELNENISFGISVGFNNALETLKSVAISPVTNKLIITEEQKQSFVLSSVVSVPISFKQKKYYQLADNKGKPTGAVHRISDFSALASINLVSFQGAQSGNVFNQKISGGLGFAYNFDEDFSVGVTLELLSYRKPKEFLLELGNTIIMENGNPVTSLDITDNRYFFDKYATTLAIKFIYKLTK